MNRRQEIECAIARCWPDVTRVCREAAATPAEVRAVIDGMDDAVNAPPPPPPTRTIHDCDEHPPGSLRCHDDHDCRCYECRWSVYVLRGFQTAGHFTTTSLANLWHSEYTHHDRARPIPDLLRNEERAYQRAKKRARPDLGTQDAPPPDLGREDLGPQDVTPAA